MYICVGIELSLDLCTHAPHDYTRGGGGVLSVWQLTSGVMSSCPRLSPIKMSVPAL